MNQMYCEELDLEWVITQGYPAWSILARQYFAQMRKTKPTLFYVSSKEVSPDRFIRKVLTMADALKKDGNAEILKPAYFGFYDSTIMGDKK